jgi:hypothetical protein
MAKRPHRIRQSDLGTSQRGLRPDLESPILSASKFVIDVVNPDGSVETRLILREGEPDEWIDLCSQRDLQDSER